MKFIDALETIMNKTWARFWLIPTKLYERKNALLDEQIKELKKLLKIFQKV